MTTDFAWLNEHSREIYEKYLGQWIAVHDGKIVGVGETAVEAARQADQACPDKNYILEAVDAEPERV